MLPLKLLRSLVFGETINNHPLLLSHHDHDHPSVNHTHHRESPKLKTPFLLFLPTNELVTDTYRLASIARDLGMDLYPSHSLSHIIFSYPSPSTPSSSFPLSFSSLSLSSSTSLSCSLPKDAVPLPFPSLASSSLFHLRSFVSLSKGLFKLVYVTTNNSEAVCESSSHWNCCSISLYSRLTGDRIDTMDVFSRALAGMGWTLFKTNKNPSPDSDRGQFSGGNCVYLFRKVELNRVRARLGDGFGRERRIRELRLPAFDFRNAPLRILQYIVLMTDDIFFLA